MSPILRNVDWLIARAGGDHLVIECKHCSRTDRIYFPLTADALGYLTRGYQEVHRDCKEKV
jgi:Holliday junction resolvase